MSATWETADLDLPAFESPLANAANPLIIQRVPSPESIACTQDRQSIIKFNMSSHNTKSTLPIASKQTIGTLDDRVVGKNPKRCSTRR